MAQQKGIIPLNGTIGNITFYKSKDGYLAREKGGIDARRIASDPAFQRTRENGMEFGRAGKAGKYLRDAVRSLLQNASDSKMVSRLTRKMMEVLKADELSARGDRNVTGGKPGLLEGFEFNINGKLNSTLYAPYTATIDRASGLLSVDIPAFVPGNMITAPAGTTHFRIKTAGAEVDFKEGTHVSEVGNLADIALNNDISNALSQTHNVTAGSTKTLFILLGVDFFQEVNGSMYSLKNGAFNALSIIKVSES
ncbi:MAG TPA: hypothetical protein VIJ92_11930 [Ginsengibacter sp.]